MIGVFLKTFYLFCNKLLGLITCDTFADNKSKTVSIFFSRFFTTGTSGVDAFAYDWSKYNNWIVPPVHLMYMTISLMRMCKPRGTLLIPKWMSAVFWPMIINSFTDNHQSYIKDLREYKYPPKTIPTRIARKSIFAKQPFNSSALVLLINFHYRLLFYNVTHCDRFSICVT